MSQVTETANNFILSIKNFDGVDVVKAQGEKQKLSVKSHYPIEYKDTEIELGLIEFFDESIGYTYGDVIIHSAESAHCTTGTLLASIILKNQEQIPPEWDKYKLVFPGLIWTDPNGHRGLSVVEKKEDVWVFTIVPIDHFPSFPNSRFVHDCRQIEFPQKVQLK